jgi:hypothetical protein
MHSNLCVNGLLWSCNCCLSLFGTTCCEAYFAYFSSIFRSAKAYNIRSGVWTDKLWLWTVQETPEHMLFEDILTWDGKFSVLLVNKGFFLVWFRVFSAWSLRSYVYTTDGAWNNTALINFCDLDSPLPPWNPSPVHRTLHVRLTRHFCRH